MADLQQRPTAVMSSKILKETEATIPTLTVRINTIVKLKGFAEVNEPKTFHDITRQDIIDFLYSYRKPER